MAIGLKTMTETNMTESKLKMKIKSVKQPVYVCRYVKKFCQRGCYFEIIASFSTKELTILMCNNSIIKCLFFLFSVFKVLLLPLLLLLSIITITIGIVITTTVNHYYTYYLSYHNFCFYFPDFDECFTLVNNTCSQSCLNVLGSYNCECSDGYQIHPDGSDCLGEHMFHISRASSFGISIPFKNC